MDRASLETLFYNLDNKYLSREEQELLRDGFWLWQEISHLPKSPHLSDYSFLVAPFAKAYEGFLKKFFLQLNLISQRDYYGDHFRVGRVLNPNLRYQPYSVYRPLEKLGYRRQSIANLLWRAWKQGRNLVFHYFPHNLQRLSRGEAEKRIYLILKAIAAASAVLDKKKNGGDNGTLK